MIYRVISDGKMDQDKIKRLLEISDQQDQIKLKVLHNAVIKCLKDYQAESTSAHLNDWQKAEQAIEALIDDLWAKHFKAEKTLTTIMSVVDHLNAQGWKVKKSAVYNHQKEGKLRPGPDGSYRIADVEKYAATFLKRLDGSQTGKLDRLQQEKLVAEIEKTKAQARHWTVRADVSSGSYVPRDRFEMELARRVSVFRNDLETFASAEAGGIVALASGDPGKIPDVIQHLLGRFEDFLARYAAEKEFKVPLPPAEKDDPDDEAEEQDE